MAFLHIFMISCVAYGLFVIIHVTFFQFMIYICLHVFVCLFHRYPDANSATGFVVVKDYNSRCNFCIQLMSRDKRRMVRHIQACAAVPSNRLYVFICFCCVWLLVFYRYVFFGLFFLSLFFCRYLFAV